MKRVVRSKATRAYLSPKGKWVSDFRFAENFVDVEAASCAVRRAEVKDAEFVLVMGEKPSDYYDVALSCFR